MNAAITSVYIVIALCTPVTVVFRSATICEIETFITLESSTMMNWADARMISGSHLRIARLSGPATSQERRQRAPEPALEPLPPPSGGTPRCERAMSGSNSRSSISSAVSALCASIMISLLR